MALVSESDANLVSGAYYFFAVKTPLSFSWSLTLFRKIEDVKCNTNILHKKD